ncbi:MAG: hypothetical protein SPL05_01430 [Eubacteriales bacterium]|nr:hypothetical protein [Eubacteriales bacterium]
MPISIDYKKLIDKMSKDILEGRLLLNDEITFDRNENGKIIDYYFKNDSTGKETATVYKILQEMMKKNSLTGYVTVQDWALLNGLEESWARRKCASGYIKSAFKMGKQWLVDPMEENRDNRVKE